MPGDVLSRGVVATGLALAVVSSPAGGQTTGIPTTSTRQFTGGNAKVTVTGSVQVEPEAAINGKASYGDGEMTRPPAAS